MHIEAIKLGRKLTEHRYQIGHESHAEVILIELARQDLEVLISDGATLLELDEGLVVAPTNAGESRLEGDQFLSQVMSFFDDERRKAIYAQAWEDFRTEIFPYDLAVIFA